MVQRISLQQFIIGGGAVAVVSIVTMMMLILLGDDVGSREEIPRSDDAATASDDEHWIDVNRSTFEVTLYQGSRPQAVFTAKLGKDQSADGFYATATGTYEVYSMNAGLAPTSFYPGGYLTEWVGFDPERFNGFHSPVRDANGEPFETQGEHTLGCVRLSEADARSVFAFAELGMRVEVHE